MSSRASLAMRMLGSSSLIILFMAARGIVSSSSSPAAGPPVPSFFSVSSAACLEFMTMTGDDVPSNKQCLQHSASTVAVLPD
uniref:Putative secreted protein n=1 Tax=Ixodes ricinus TaxID=34613 RepID=A0A6B0TWP6_IXORI